jgi:hyperosmotically inducible protein
MAASLMTFGCADRNKDAVPDQTQTNMPGTAADRTQDVGANTAEVGDNAVTTAKIKNKLITDPQIKAADINVDTKDDVVTLTGAVDTAAQKMRAAEIAKAHEGVRTVVNNITVKAKGQ